MDEARKHMIKTLEEAMYGRKPFKAGDLVVYRPMEGKKTAIKNLTPGNVYEIVDIPGHEYKPGRALYIVNDKNLKNGYRDEWFEHHTIGELKGMAEIVKAFKPLKELTDSKTTKKQTKRDVIKENIKKREQEERIKLDFMEELKGL